MTRPVIRHRIERLGLVPVIRVPSGDLAVRAGKALHEGGVHVLEITMTVPGAVEVLAELRATFGDSVLLGAGTVTDPETAVRCIAAGAEFIVSPTFDLQTLEATQAHDKPMLAGALTPTEVLTAWRAGADMVKVFPCSSMGGAKYIKALKDPFPEIRLLPTGGVDLSTARDYLVAGASALGVGTSLVDARELVSGGEDALIERARRFLAIVGAQRSAFQSTD